MSPPSFPVLLDLAILTDLSRTTIKPMSAIHGGLIIFQSKEENGTISIATLPT